MKFYVFALVGVLIKLLCEMYCVMIKITTLHVTLLLHTENKVTFEPFCILDNVGTDGLCMLRVWVRRVVVKGLGGETGGKETTGEN